MSKHNTPTGTLEVVKTSRGALIRLVNHSTMHECGITIPRKNLWSFTNRWFFFGAHESIELIVKNDRIVITIIVNFGRDIPASTTVSRAEWNEIESEIKGMI